MVASLKNLPDHGRERRRVGRHSLLKETRREGTWLFRHLGGGQR
jgi:hypothetical protein